MRIKAQSSPVRGCISVRPHGFPLRSLVSLLFWVSASLLVCAQSTSVLPGPTFRSEVRLLEVDVNVRDGDGQFVPDLTKDDFELLEDGQPQAIWSVTEANFPVDRRGRPPEGLDHVSTDVNLSTAGRVYVLVMNSGDAQQVETIARRFVTEFVGPLDLMAVMHGARAATRGLTNDKNELLTAVDAYVGGGGAPLRILKDIAVNLGAIGGRRKAVLFVDANIGKEVTDFERDSAARREYQDTIRTAVRNEVRIYPIDPRGFQVRFSDMTQESLPPVGVGFSAPAASGMGVGSAARIMAADTGGIAIVNTNNYDGNFARIVRDNSQYYTVAFYSSAPRDGAFHRIVVRVKSRPDANISARAGYRAPPADVRGKAVKLPRGLTESARATLSGAFAAAGDSPLEVFAAVFRTERYEGSVVVGAHIPGKDLQLGDGARIELSYAAVDRWGTIRAAERRGFSLALSETMRARVAQTGVRIFGRVQLPRGIYQIRVAASQPNSSSMASVTEVEVPDFSDVSMSISDVVLASTLRPPLITLEEDPLLRRLLPSQPTTSRRFDRADTVGIFAEVYDSHWILTKEIGVTAVIRSSAGTIISRQEHILKSDNRGHFNFVGKVMLRTFPPGQYEVNIEAFTRDGVPASASRSLTFDVE